MVAGGSLLISNLTEEDAGLYTCVAYNGIDNSTIDAQAQLTVQGTMLFCRASLHLEFKISMLFMWLFV